MVTGRDVHVRVARRGWLAPFGHVASVIEIADRTFDVDTAGGIAAALRLREFLAVSPNTVDTATLAPAMAHAGRELPFGPSTSSPASSSRSRAPRSRGWSTTAGCSSRPT